MTQYMSSTDIASIVRLMVLEDPRFWQGCRVIESILCIKISGAFQSYCSPLGLRREGGMLLIRIYHDGFIGNIIGGKRSGVIYICRDPLLIYESLYNHDLDEGSLAELCSVVAEIHANIYRYGRDYDEYIVNVLSYLKIEPRDPRLIARICRSENLFVEALIHSTRRHLALSSTSKYIEEFCLEYRYFIENAERLTDRGEIRRALTQIPREPCV